MDSYYAATASTLARPKCHLHVNLQPQALLALLVDRDLSRHLAINLGILLLTMEQEHLPVVVSKWLVAS